VGEAETPGDGRGRHGVTGGGPVEVDGEVEIGVRAAPLPEGGEEIDEADPAAAAVFAQAPVGVGGVEPLPLGVTAADVLGPDGGIDLGGARGDGDDEAPPRLTTSAWRRSTRRQVTSQARARSFGGGSR